MSHASGAVRFADGQIAYYEYDGTSDVVLSHHYPTMQEVSDNWRKGEWMTCTCGKQEPVSIYSSYGRGFYLEGIACKNCKSIASDEDDFSIDADLIDDDWARRLPEFLDN